MCLLWLLFLTHLICDDLKFTGLMFLGAHVNLISYLLPFVGSFGLTSLTLLYCYDICREIGIFSLQQTQKLSLTIFTLMPGSSVLHVLCMFATVSFANSSKIIWIIHCWHVMQVCTLIFLLCSGQLLFLIYFFGVETLFIGGVSIRKLSPCFWKCPASCFLPRRWSSLRIWR